MLQLATYDPHLKVFLILHNIIQWLYRSLRYQSLYTKLAYLFPSGWASRTLWPFSTAHNACGAHSSSSLGSPTAFSELWMIMLLLGPFSSSISNPNHASFPGPPQPTLLVEIFYFTGLRLLSSQAKPLLSPSLGTLMSPSQTGSQAVPCRTLPLTLKVEPYFPFCGNASAS